MSKLRSGAWRTSCLAALAFFSITACGGGGDETPMVPTPLAAQNLSASVTSGGRNRTYLARVPAKSDASVALPLVIALHGGGGTGMGMRSLTGLDAQADANGFVVVYPDGYSNSWADGRGTSEAELAGVDDVAFVSALIDDIAARTPIDRRRVYAIGISNGGMMSIRLACQLSARVTAAASVAANMPVNLQSNCSPARPVPMMFVHGDLDPLMPRAGGLIPVGSGGMVLSTAQSLAFWNSRNGCPGMPAVVTTIDPAADGTTVIYSRYAPCTNSAENRFYDVVGGGHTWPGGLQYQPVAIIGRTSLDINAGQEAWQFFRAFAL